MKKRTVKRVSRTAEEGMIARATGTTGRAGPRRLPGGVTLGLLLLRGQVLPSMVGCAWSITSMPQPMLSAQVLSRASPALPAYPMPTP